MYEITDDDDQVIQGKFYEQELQVLPKKPDVYTVPIISNEPPKYYFSKFKI
jgi:hypothetical protein